MYSDNKQIRDVADVAARIMAGLPPLEEKLHPNQQKIDVVDDEKIDGKDFAKLRKMKKEEAEQQDEAMSHQAKTTMKHIPNPTPAQKQAAKDIKPGVGGYRDRIDMLKSAGVKEEVEAIDEVKMADLPSTKVQGRAYGSSKPEASAFDVLKGPKDKELKSIESEKKKKKMSEMVATYKDGGMKAFFESIEKEEMISEEPDSAQFAKELEDQKKRAAGTKPQAEVAKPSVQAVKNESIEEEYEDSDEEHPMMYKHVSSVNSNTWSATAKHHGKNLPKVVKDLEKERDSIKKKGGNHNATSNHDHAIMQLKQHLPSTNEEVEQDIQVINADGANGVDQVNIEERTLTAGETKKKEEIVKSMKKGLAGFKDRYGDKAKSVMYATATKQAKLKEETESKHYEAGHEYASDHAQDSGFKVTARARKKEMLADNPHKKGTTEHSDWHRGALDGHQTALDNM